MRFCGGLRACVRMHLLVRVLQPVRIFKEKRAPATNYDRESQRQIFGIRCSLASTDLALHAGCRAEDQAICAQTSCSFELDTRFLSEARSVLRLHMVESLHSTAG